MTTSEEEKKKTVRRGRKPRQHCLQVRGRERGKVLPGGARINAMSKCIVFHTPERDSFFSASVHSMDGLVNKVNDVWRKKELSEKKTALRISKVVWPFSQFSAVDSRWISMVTRSTAPTVDDDHPSITTNRGDRVWEVPIVSNSRLQHDVTSTAMVDWILVHRCWPTSSTLPVEWHWISSVSPHNHDGSSLSRHSLIVPGLGNLRHLSSSSTELRIFHEALLPSVGNKSPERKKENQHTPERRAMIQNALESSHRFRQPCCYWNRMKNLREQIEFQRRKSENRICVRCGLERRVQISQLSLLRKRLLVSIIPHSYQQSRWVWESHWEKFRLLWRFHNWMEHSLRAFDYLNLSKVIVTSVEVRPVPTREFCCFRANRFVWIKKLDELILEEKSWFLKGDTSSRSYLLIFSAAVHRLAWHARWIWRELSLVGIDTTKIYWQADSHHR